VEAVSRRSRSWAPPRGASSPPVVLSQGTIPVEDDVASSTAPAASWGWLRWPGPIAVSRPPCQHRGCSQPAMEWNRCRCGAVFSLCGEHGQAGAAMRERAAHGAKGDPACQMGHPRPVVVEPADGQAAVVIAVEVAGAVGGTAAVAGDGGRRRAVEEPVDAVHGLDAPLAFARRKLLARLARARRSRAA
jgi:hypothetical protein